VNVTGPSFNSPGLRRLVTRVLLALSILLAVPLVGACGDDDQKMARPPDPRANRPTKKKGTLDISGLQDIHITNPRWDLLKTHFTKSASKRHTQVHDAFRPQVLNFIPRPEIPEADSTEAVEDIQGDKELVRGPLQLFPLADYDLLLIMSGIAVPKALVVDPKGQTHVVTRDMRLGDTGGMIEQITQYMLVVREPNSEKPYKVTIKPALMGLTTKLASSSEASPETADATPLPASTVSEP